MAADRGAVQGLIADPLSLPAHQYPRRERLGRAEKPRCRAGLKRVKSAARSPAEAYPAPVVRGRARGHAPAVRGSVFPHHRPVKHESPAADNDTAPGADPGGAAEAFLKKIQNGSASREYKPEIKKERMEKADERIARQRKNLD